MERCEFNDQHLYITYNHHAAVHHRFTDVDAINGIDPVKLFALADMDTVGEGALVNIRNVPFPFLMKDAKSYVSDEYGTVGDRDQAVTNALATVRNYQHDIRNTVS